ncbi:hypothetical protein BJ912DRAFT_1113997 [Pholiota molesta]|nr:hypothetical protein BJ912DRAFT_1113997 [Pholiota molesta]
MHFTAFLTSLGVAATFAVSASADTIVAYSGSSCDGTVGSVVTCDGSCIQFSGRHSLEISGGGTHCITYFENTSCTFFEGQGGTDIVGSGVCHNVNTGGDVSAFMCAPTTTCEI